jgi:hypothetical protein
MKKLTLHLGMHRCASTTTQNMLKSNRDLLAGRGVGVVLRPDMETNSSIDIRRWHRQSAVDIRSWGSMARFADALDRMEHDHLIISEENLVGPMPAVLSRNFYPHIEQFLKRVAGLKDRFDLQLRFVVRRQDRFLESVYAFRLGRGLTEGFEAFLDSFPPNCFEWNKVTSALNKYQLTEASQIFVMDNCSGRVLGERLAMLIGLELAGLKLGGSGNKSLPAACMPLLLAVNRADVMPDLQDRKQALFPLLKRAVEADIHVLAPLFSAAEMRRVNELFEPQEPVGFSAAGRVDFLKVYKTVNQRFLSDASMQHTLEDIW